MAQLILSQSSKWNRVIHRKGAMPLSLHVGKFFLFFSMTFMIGLLSFFYLIKSTEIHTKGYQLRKLELAKNSLMAAREIKSMDIAQLKSLKAIRESDVASRMIPARNPVFIKKDGTVALLR